MTGPTFQASGLASGMDTGTIVDKLVALESIPLTQNQTQQSNTKAQVSALGSIITSLNSLETATQDLATNGAYAAKTASANTSFTATTGTGATPGSYSLAVEQLATAAKWRSDGFASTDTMAAGTLSLTVQGIQYPPASGSSGPIVITQGDSLQDVAYKIRQSGAPVSAQVLTDSSGKSYLTLTNQDTGQPLDGSSALSVNFTRAATATGNNLDFGSPTVTGAVNAKFQLDGLEFVRSSNSVSDVLPGTTLNLTSTSSASTPEDLVIATDPDATQARLQKFVDAYNGVIKLVQGQLNVNKDTDRTKTLAGDSSVRDLQTRVQQLISTMVPGLGNVRTLADLGIKTANDGSLSIDSSVLTTALSTDTSAVNSIFANASGGIGAVVKSLVNSETEAGDGLLVTDQNNLNQNIKDLAEQATTLQARIDAYRQGLEAQFTAMETIISQLKTMGSFLSGTTSTTTSNSSTSSSSSSG